MPIAVRALLVMLPCLAIACGGSDAEPGSAESNLDTSGCSGLDTRSVSGPVGVSAARPPRSSCWNIEESGLSLTYSWLQVNDDQPQKKNVGFYVSLNGGDTYLKADAYDCKASTSFGLGHDTSGDRTFECAAHKRVDFGHSPKLREAAYGSDGHRLAWSVGVAVSLDDNGNWDSLGGANYRFSF